MTRLIRRRPRTVGEYAAASVLFPAAYLGHGLGKVSRSIKRFSRSPKTRGGVRMGIGLGLAGAGGGMMGSAGIGNVPGFLGGMAVANYGTQQYVKGWKRAGLDKSKGPAARLLGPSPRRQGKGAFGGRGAFAGRGRGWKKYAKRRR